ncbi:hypothetical protein BDV11DRAFT_171655 [Aspergillus similis]
MAHANGKAREALAKDAFQGPQRAQKQWTPASSAAGGDEAGGGHGSIGSDQVAHVRDQKVDEGQYKLRKSYNEVLKELDYRDKALEEVERALGLPTGGPSESAQYRTGNHWMFPGSRIAIVPMYRFLVYALIGVVACGPSVSLG